MPSADLRYGGGGRPVGGPCAGGRPGAAPAMSGRAWSLGTGVAAARAAEVAAHEAAMEEGDSMLYADGRRSDGSWAAQGAQEAQEDEHAHEAEDVHEEVGVRAHSSNSWHETLARYPSLMRLYPLAAASEGGVPEGWEEAEAAELQGSGGGGASPSREPSFAAVDGAEAEPAEAGPHAPLEQEPTALRRDASLPRPATPDPMHPGRLSTTPRGEPPCADSVTRARSGRSAGCGHPGVSAPTTPHSHPHAGGWGMVQTPRSVGSTSRVGPRPRSARGGRAGHGGAPSERLSSHSGSGCWSQNADIAAAWAEVEQARQSLAQREREVQLREAAVRRAEARNLATSSHLTELRQRLDEYGRELEEGVAALTAQQHSLREEQRQAELMQARARRMCAAAVRDDVVGSKVRDWERLRA